MSDPFEDTDLVELCHPLLHGITLRDLPNKGRGYVATRDMRIGDVVFEASSIKFTCNSAGTSIEEASASLTYGLLCSQRTRQIPLTILYSNAATAEEYSTRMNPTAGMLRDAQVTREQWFRSIAAVRVNSWGDAPQGRDGAYRKLSIYLNLFGSFFNHSCAPNAYLDNASNNTPDKAMLIRDVKQGDEVTFAYPCAKILLRPASMRQEVLGVSWGFVCACERCTTDRAAEEEAQMATSIDKAEHEVIESILNKTIMTSADSLEIQRVISHMCEHTTFDWRAHAIRQRLIEVVVDTQCTLGRTLASHYRDFLGSVTTMQKRYLAPASLYKEQVYNTAMHVGPYYGITRSDVFDTLVAADPWYASSEFIRTYHPEVSPASFATHNVSQQPHA